MIQQGTNNVYPEVEGLSVLLGYKTQNAGCCKVNPTLLPTLLAPDSSDDQQHVLHCSFFIDFQLVYEISESVPDRAPSRPAGQAAAAKFVQWTVIALLSFCIDVMEVSVMLSRVQLSH